jgi:hypothetical protein
MIKLRAWHKFINIYIQVDAIDFKGEEIKKGEPCIVDSRENGGCYMLKNCIIEEYSEREDKNGKEIWEGDILKDLYEGSVGVVKNENGSFITDCSGFGDESFYGKDFSSIEIIGNINQDRDLYNG